MDTILQLAKRNRHRAWEIIRELDLIAVWESIGAEINLVGSLRMGLLMKHRDIDFHIYSAPVEVADSFRAVARLAEHPRVERIECANALRTEEACIEWHLRYRDEDDELWQIDMIHLQRGSKYDGFFERMAERISAALTEETRQVVLRLKYETPDDEKIMGVEYYQAVLRDGVRSYEEFRNWREKHPVSGIVEWTP